MFRPTQTSVVVLWLSITTPALLVTQANGRHWSSSLATTGGRRCPTTLGSMSEPVTPAHGPNFTIASQLANYTQWRHLRSARTRSVSTL
jgi:hypothetical protein